MVFEGNEGIDFVDFTLLGGNGKKISSAKGIGEQRLKSDKISDLIIKLFGIQMKSEHFNFISNQAELEELSLLKYMVTNNRGIINFQNYNERNKGRRRLRQGPGQA